MPPKASASKKKIIPVRFTAILPQKKTDGSHAEPQVEVVASHVAPEAAPRQRVELPSSPAGAHSVVVKRAAAAAAVLDAACVPVVCLAAGRNDWTEERERSPAWVPALGQTDIAAARIAAAEHRASDFRPRRPRRAVVHRDVKLCGNEDNAR